MSALKLTVATEPLITDSVLVTLKMTKKLNPDGDFLFEINSSRIVLLLL